LHIYIPTYELYHNDTKKARKSLKFLAFSEIYFLAFVQTREKSIPILAEICFFRKTVV